MNPINAVLNELKDDFVTKNETDARKSFPVPTIIHLHITCTNLKLYTIHSNLQHLNHLGLVPVKRQRIKFTYSRENTFQKLPKINYLPHCQIVIIHITHFLGVNFHCKQCAVIMQVAQKNNNNQLISVLNRCFLTGKNWRVLLILPFCFNETVML